MSLTEKTIQIIHEQTDSFTSVILKCNPNDGLYQSLLLAKAGYDVLVVDFTGQYKPMFIPYENCKYFFPKVQIEYTGKRYEAYCVLISQFVNQIREEFSLLCCGINKTRLETASQHKYGEKGDKNYIGHLSQSEVIYELESEFNVSNLVSIDYKNTESNEHKFRYPICFLHEIKRTENPINLGEIKHPTTLYPMSQNISSLLHEFNFEQGFYDVNWPKRFIEEKLNKLEAYCVRHEKYNLNLAISGGIDSSVTLLILKKLEERNPKFKVNAFTIPISSTEQIQNRARELCTSLNYEFQEINLTEEHKQFCDSICREMEDEQIPIKKDRSYVYGCTKSNFRGFTMVSIALNNNGLIVGTGNKDEDVFLKFFSVYGDGFVDVSFMGDVPKFCVYILGNYLGVPENILYASPSPDLMTTNNSDEEEMGTSYEYASLFLFILENPKFAKKIIEKYSFTKEDKELFSKHFSKILGIRKRSYHKSVKPENVTNPDVGSHFKDNRIFPYYFQCLDEEEFKIQNALRIIKNPVYIYYTGFFSAVTNAHLEIVKKAILSQERYVVFVLSPASKNYVKKGYEWITYKDRFLSCQLIREEVMKMDGNFEIVINKESELDKFLGTYYHLNEFCQENQVEKEDVIFLCGSDNFENIISGKWINWQEFLRDYNFMVINRGSKKFSSIDLETSFPSSSDILDGNEEFISESCRLHNRNLRIKREISSNLGLKEIAVYEHFSLKDTEFEKYISSNIKKIALLISDVRRYKNSATMFNDHYKISMCKLIKKMHKNLTVTFSVDLRKEKDRICAFMKKDLIREKILTLEERRFFEEILPEELKELANYHLIDEVLDHKFEGETDRVIVSIYVAYDYKLQKERLFIDVTGPWFRVTWVETPLMQVIYSIISSKESIISLMDGCFRSIKFANKIGKKCCLMSGRRSNSADFLIIQNMMMHDLCNNYLGTSSIDCNHILSKHGYESKPFGTSGHEISMVFSCLYPDQKLPLSSLFTHYCLHSLENKKICILPDTITTECFVRAMKVIKIKGNDFTSIVSSARHDSGSIEHFCNLLPEFPIISTEISKEDDLRKLQIYDNVKAFGAGGFFGDNQGTSVSIAVKVIRVYHEGRVMYPVKLSDEPGKESVDTSLENYSEIVQRYKDLAVNTEFDIEEEQRKFDELINTV